MTARHRRLLLACALLMVPALLLVVDGPVPAGPDARRAPDPADVVPAPERAGRPAEAPQVVAGSAAGSAGATAAAREDAGPEPARIVGRLVDHSGAPVVAGRLLLEVGEGAPRDLRLRAAPTDGAFALEVAAAGEARAVGARDPFTSSRTTGFYFELVPGGTVDLGTLELPPEHAIEGRALWVDGRPAAGVSLAAYPAGEGHLQFHDATARTREDGRFRLDGLRPRDYRVHHREWGAFRVRSGNPVAAGELDAELVLEAAVIEVECRDEQDRPVPMVELTTERVHAGGATGRSGETFGARGRLRHELTAADVVRVDHRAVGVDGRTYHGSFSGPFTSGRREHLLSVDPPGTGRVRFRLDRDVVPRSAQLELHRWRGDAGRRDERIVATVGPDEDAPVLTTPPLRPGSYRFRLALLGAGRLCLAADEVELDVPVGEPVEHRLATVEGGCVVLGVTPLPRRVAANVYVGRSQLERLYLLPGEPPDAFDPDRFLRSVYLFRPDQGPWTTQPLRPGDHRLWFGTQGHRPRTFEVHVEAGRDVRLIPILEPK